MISNLQKLVAVDDYDELLTVNCVFWNIMQKGGKLWLKQKFLSFLKKNLLLNIFISYWISRV
jgi:hypothetical protein